MNTHNLSKKYSDIAGIYQAIEGQGHTFLYIHGECLSLFRIVYCLIDDSEEFVIMAQICIVSAILK